MKRLKTIPWPHLIVDNFLPDKILVQSIAEIKAENYDYGIESRGTGRIEFSLLKSKTLWRAIYSKETVAFLSEAFTEKLRLNNHNYIQLRRMNDDTPDFPIHNDYTSDEDTIVSFLYISPGWTSSSGGRLHLFESRDQLAPAVSIEPLQNRLVAFRTNASHWHAVQRVSGWERLSVLALWDVD
jgi:2OG-Fe(II) oxygenase superfamily